MTAYGRCRQTRRLSWEDVGREGRLQVKRVCVNIDILLACVVLPPSLPPSAPLVRVISTAVLTRFVVR